MASHRLTRAAAGDLAAILRWGLAEYGSAQALHYLDTIERAFDFLANFPRAARLRDEIQPPVRVYPCQAHLIIYEVGAGDEILILRIRHGRENWQ